MKHIIIGGDGFVGSHLAADLAALGETVLVADIAKSNHAHYAAVPFHKIDVTKAESVESLRWRRRTWSITSRPRCSRRS